MGRRPVVILVFLFMVACLIVVAVLALLAVTTVPGVARLVFGDPRTATPAQASVPPIPHLTTATQTFTPTPVDLGPEATFTPAPAPIAPTQSEPVTLPTASAPSSPPQQPEYTATPVADRPQPTATPSSSEWIAFETERGEFGDYEIYATTPDGSRLVNLTNSWADDVAPVWSPDGRYIAFVSLRDTIAGKWGLEPASIYVMGFDPIAGVGDGNVVRVTGPEGNDGWPTWSPDGQRLAFHSDRSGDWEIWAVNLNGSELVNLTNHPADDRFPAWSPSLPTGERIAFTSKRSGDLDVWSMPVDGSDPVNLTNSPRRDQYPMWSPDGNRLTFNTARDGNYEIYIMNSDGSNPTNISNSPDSIEGLADWSPDSKRLVLYSDRPGNKDLFVVSLSNGRWTNITNHPASDEFCTWSP